jgi:hypothetical protein
VSEGGAGCCGSRMIDRGIGKPATSVGNIPARSLNKKKQKQKLSSPTTGLIEWCDWRPCAPVRDSSGDRESERVLVATAATMLIAVDSAVRWAGWENDRAQANSLSFSFLFVCSMLIRNRGETVRWITMA